MRPRPLAVRVLARVLTDQQALDEVLSESAGDLTPAGRAWLKEVCSGTLRWKGRLELAIDFYAERKKPSGWLRRAMLIAAYQLVVQENTPAAPVVSETVEEIRKKEGKAPAAFANALLRRLAEDAPKWRLWPESVGSKSPVREQAAWASLPEWLWKRILSAYGFDWARAFAESVLERPSIWIRARESGWSADWADPGPVPGSFRVNTGGRVVEKEGFSEGAFLVQDISNQILVREITGTVEDVRGGRGRSLSAFDACAAPGGKSVGMAWSGFRVTATDRDELRMALLKETVDRAAAKDVTVVPFQDKGNVGSHDLVWVDAPCTATGIIRRHPDVRWLRREADVESLARTQLDIVREAWNHVLPGGFLAYSVCSILPREGEAVLAAAGLQQHEVRRWFLAPQDEPLRDGFFAALIRKPEGAE